MKNGNPVIAGFSFDIIQKASEEVKTTKDQFFTVHPEKRITILWCFTFIKQESAEVTKQGYLWFKTYKKLLKYALEIYGDASPEYQERLMEFFLGEGLGKKMYSEESFPVEPKILVDEYLQVISDSLKSLIKNYTN